MILSDSVVMKFNHPYLMICGDEVDKLCRWVAELRDLFGSEGPRVLYPGKIVQLC